LLCKSHLLTQYDSDRQAYFEHSGRRSHEFEFASLWHGRESDKTIQHRLSNKRLQLPALPLNRLWSAAAVASHQFYRRRLLLLYDRLTRLDGPQLQYWLSRAAESSKQQILLKGQAYVDYLRAVVKAAYATSVEQARASLSDAADAKARIAIYGSEAVVAALAKFESGGPVLDNPAAIERLIELALAMRNHRVLQSDLRLVLFGPAGTHDGPSTGTYTNKGSIKEKTS
jgi:hypothetical protein